MNVAVIFAGGVGKRMKISTLPKQFLELNGKPIIIYTLEKFDQHPEIDGIIVVCTPGWIDYLKNLLVKFNIQKVDAIVEGGKTGQDSRFNGIKKAHELYPEDTVILMHDGVRPMIEAEVISQNIHSVRTNGSAITVSPAIETVTICDIHGQIENIMDRSSCCMAKAPQSFYLKDLYKVHSRAEQEGKHDFIDTAYIMNAYGYSLFPVECGAENIKITTPSDFYMFKAFMAAKEDSEVFG